LNKLKRNVLFLLISAASLVTRNLSRVIIKEQLPKVNLLNARNITNCSLQSFQTQTLIANNGSLCGSLVKNILINTTPNVLAQQQRSLTKFSLKKGTRKSVKAVLKRFMRLNWGGWIRTHSGRNKKLWRKSKNLRRRLRQHIFVNGTQSFLLDKMVTKYWRHPRFYVDDPYQPYHTREEYFATNKKPLKY